MTGENIPGQVGRNLDRRYSPAPFLPLSADHINSISSFCRTECDNTRGLTWNRHCRRNSGVRSMMTVQFDKQYVQSVLDALKAGEPIPPQPGHGGWTNRSMLTIAGVMLSGLVSQGP